MSDHFGTVNASGAQRAREIEVMRAHYRRHREALVEMAADAPTESLANAYHTLIRDIDGSLAKLDDLERGVSTPVLSTAAAIPTKTEPGQRPVQHQPFADDEPTHTNYVPPEDRRPGASGGKLVAIILAGVVVLGLIGWVVWRGSSDRTADNDVVVEDTAGQTAVAPDTTEPEPAPTTTTAPPAAAEALAITPDSQNYGVIRKGTRATRQYEIRNNSDNPVTVTVSRSACRCLFYEYEALIPPKGKESLTVTVDAARAKGGALLETIQVAAKSDPSVSASFQLTAEIQ